MFLGINLKKMMQSFKFAFCGIKIIFEKEQVFKAMLFIAILVIIAMFYFNLPLIQKIILFTLIVFVLMLELVNSTIERVLDFICPQINPRVKEIKDMLAGLVLISCIGSIIIGILIFLPYLPIK